MSEEEREQVLKRSLSIYALALLMLALNPLQTPYPNATSPPTGYSSHLNLVQAAVGIAPMPYTLTLKFQGNMPELTDAQMQILRDASMRRSLPKTQSNGGVTLKAVTVQDTSLETSPQSLSDFAVFTNATVQLPGSAPKSLVGEPSVAQKNDIVFYTANWYAARSSDGGTNWTYYNTFSDMSDFCCDQDTTYNPSRGIFIWYRMGRPQSDGTNRFLLGVSTNASTWFFYSIHPTNINPTWTGQIFDFIIMAYSNNYLYLTTNLFRNQTYTNSLILRLSLDNLKNHSAFTFSSFFTRNEGFAPVQGAQQTMYFATHFDSSHLQLYIWNENTTSLILPALISHSAFTVTNVGDASCPAPDGGNICKRLDDRILGGWLANKVIGFVWNVAQGASFTEPYTYVIRLNQTNLTVIDTPIIANPNYAWVYTWVAPNARGDLGLIAFTAGATLYPTLNAGLVDAFTGKPPPWQFYRVATSTNGPSTSCIDGTSNACWGDYIRVRPFNGTSNAWIATGYTLQGGNSGAFIQPRYLVFGRIRDDPFNYSVVTFLTVPSVVGSINFNGTTYKNGQIGVYNFTSYTARANLPPNHSFARWSGTGGVSVSNPLSNPTTVTLMGPGNLTAILIPPNITVTFHTNPGGLGVIVCSGQTFSDGQSGQLPSNTTISCRAGVPAGYHFASWGGLATGTAQTTNVFTGNGGSLTANFAYGPASIPAAAALTAGLLLAVVILSKRRMTRLRR